MAANILGLAYHLPDKIETSDDLSRENPNWNMDQVYDKSGIYSRHIAEQEETAGDLALQAAKKLLACEIVAPEEIDFLLYCTQSPDYYLPSVSCILQCKLGLGKHSGAFDINLGCSGWIYGIQLAKAYIDNGTARNILLITADTYSKYIHPKDRSVRPLFGDGASATIIGRSGNERGDIGHFVVGTNGAGAEKLIVPAGCLRTPHSSITAIEKTDEKGCVRSQDNLYMDGAAVFSFAITVVPRTVSALLKKANLSVIDIDWFVFHQANKYILQNLAQRSDIPQDKMVYALKETGNTVSSSIPIALQQYVETDRIHAGDKLCAVGFGVGYSWGACTITW